MLSNHPFVFKSVENPFRGQGNHKVSNWLISQNVGTVVVGNINDQDLQNLSTSKIKVYSGVFGNAKDSLSLYRQGSLTENQKERLVELTQSNPQKLFSHINQNVLIWIVCVIVMLYAVMGGLEAAFLTDTIQGIFIIILSVLLIPFGWARINAAVLNAAPYRI